MWNTSPTVLLLAAVAIFVAGCDVSQDPEIPSNVNFDAAVVAADGTLEDLRMMHGPGLGLPGAVFPPLPNETDCSEFDGRLECRPFEREGLTYTRAITYLDVNGDPLVDEGGNPVTEFDELRMAGLRYQIAVEGELDRERWSASIDRERDLTVTGLLDDNTATDEDAGDGEVTWNGEGSGFVERSRHSDSGDVRTYTMESSSEILDVVIPYPRTEEGWPLSGTITRTMTLTRTSDTEGTETVTRTVTIEFDGTQFVTVTVGDDVFTLDLSERRFGPGKMRDRRGRRFDN
jgi:hypothetical protein